MYSLLPVIAKADPSLKTFSADGITYQIVEDPAITELRDAFLPCTNATTFKLHVDTSILTEKAEFHGRCLLLCQTRASRCKMALDKNRGLRDLTKSFRQLETLEITIGDYLGWSGPSRCSLEHIIEPECEWENLTSLALRGIECDRREPMTILKKQKCLNRLCLHDTSLIRSSWKILLLEMRSSLHSKLKSACICGSIQGQQEGGTRPHRESWFLDRRDNHILWLAVNICLVSDDTEYAPCPLPREWTDADRIEGEIENFYYV